MGGKKLCLDQSWGRSAWVQVRNRIARSYRATTRSIRSHATWFFEILDRTVLTSGLRNALADCHLPVFVARLVEELRCRFRRTSIWLSLLGLSEIQHLKLSLETLKTL